MNAPLLIWHIFKKDFKLLWPLAAAVLVCQVTLLLLAGREEALGLAPLLATNLLTFAIVSVSGLVIAMAVQQEPIPGAGQDWLVRPIRRRDLFLAKLLFVLGVIQVPLLATGVLHGLWEGFPLGAGLASGLRNQLGLLVLFSLPVLCIAALTRNLTEALIGSMGLFIGALVALALFAVLSTWIAKEAWLTPATLPSGVAWVWGLLSQAVQAASMITVLTLLYTTRRVRTTRVLFCAGTLAAVLVLFLPWAPAFAVQLWLSSASDALGGIAVAFEPSRAPPTETSSGAMDLVNFPLRLRYTGIPAGTVMHIDHSDIRVLDESGRTLYLGSGMGNPFEARTGVGVEAGADRPSRTADEPLTRPMVREETLIMPEETWRQLMNRRVRLQIEQSMTVLRLRTLPPIPATGGEQPLPGAARCATRLDRSGTAIQVVCIAAGDLPDCMSMALASPDGAQNPPWFQCSLSYAPLRIQPSLDVVSRLTVRLPFVDPKGWVRYPVNASKLQGTHVVLTLYEPAGHLVRRVEVSAARMRDLAPESVHGTQPGPAPAVPTDRAAH